MKLKGILVFIFLTVGLIYGEEKATKAGKVKVSWQFFAPVKKSHTMKKLFQNFVFLANFTILQHFSILVFKNFVLRRFLSKKLFFYTHAINCTRIKILLFHIKT